MAHLRNLLASFRLTFRKSTALTKIVVSAAVVLSMAALLMLHSAIETTKENTENLRQQAIEQEQEKQLLQQYAEESGTVKEVIRIAMERLGLVEPDSIVFQPE